MRWVGFGSRPLGEAQGEQSTSRVYGGAAIYSRDAAGAAVAKGNGRPGGGGGNYAPIGQHEQHNRTNSDTDYNGGGTSNSGNTPPSGGGGGGNNGGSPVNGGGGGQGRGSGGGQGAGTGAPSATPQGGDGAGECWRWRQANSLSKMAAQRAAILIVDRCFNTIDPDYSLAQGFIPHCSITSPFLSSMICANFSSPT